MRSSRAAERFLVLAFLCVIAIPPIVQTVWEWRRDRHVQALELFYERPTSAHLRAYEQELEDASWLGNGVRPWVQYAQFAWFRDGGEKTLIGRDDWLFYRPGVRYATDRPTLPEAEAVDQAHQAIVAFRDALAQRDIQLLVVIAPNKETVYPDMLSAQASDLESLRNRRRACCAIGFMTREWRWSTWADLLFHREAKVLPRSPSTCIWPRTAIGRRRESNSRRASSQNESRCSNGSHRTELSTHIE